MGTEEVRGVCSKEIPKLSIQSAMSGVIQSYSSSPGLPAGTAPRSPRPLTALFIRLHGQGEQMDAPRCPRPIVIQRACAPLLPSAGKYLPVCGLEKHRAALRRSAWGGDSGQGEGLGGF